MKGSFLLLCLVSFFPGAQSGDQMPSIVTSYVQVKEDTPINEFAFQIETQDPDVPPDPLKYYLSGPKANLFKVDENTGRVTIRNKLDREDDDKGVFTIEISISDGKYRVSKEIQIIISDANDNKPIFQDAPYNENVKENTPLDTVLFQVSATDADSGLAAVIKYHIDDASPTNGLQHFSINENTGQVKLIKNLNFNGLSTFYRLRINATDGGGPSYYNVTEFLSSTAFAFITVVDVPDLDPSFLNTPYTASVNEHSKVGLPVFKVSAIDKDTGINDVITYSIEATNPPDLFEISASDGIISVKSDIDREALLDIDAEVILTVKATEENPSILGFRANSSTQVKITINDINDNKPKFYNCDMEPCEETSIFTANIFEHSSKNLPVDGLKIKAKDMDARENGKFELHLEGPDKNAFTVLPSVAYSESEIQILVKNPDDVDYEKSTSMVVQIVAKDPNKETNCCSTATVTIQIKDINDWSPKFPEATYHLEINEHSANGTTVATIIAFDPDTMDVGKIRYRLLPDNILKYFDVDPTTGRVFVANSKLIDREVMDLHSPTLQARDMANNTGTTVLMIKLKDINDHKPKFNKDYVEYIEENSSLRIHVQATDQDEPPNSDIVYGIEKSHYSDNFTIDPTSGWLQNKGPIDRESMRTEDHGKINLTVKATDGGEIPESDSVSVIINVDDINDNGPKFRKDSYKFSVEEGKKAEFVGSVRAVDSDQTNNYNRISFRISSGSFGQFIIQTFIDQPEGYIGNITVDPDIELDYESTTKTFHLTVEAMDLGTGVDSVRVEVNVLDVNDERPKFIQKGPFFVDENSNIVDVGSFDAQDLDTNHSLIYELVSSKCRCNESLGLQPCEEDWFTLEPNGKILLNREFVVDYEKCVEVVLEAQVVDVLTQKGENNSETTGTVVIYINDVNDNPPVFEKTDNFYVVVSETASVGSEIASVSATDRDSGRNRHMTFSIAAVNFVDDVTNITSNKELVFKVVSTQEDDKFVGKIQNNEALNIDVKGKYLVTVVARNTEMPNLFSETKLEILTVDKSLKVELLFSKPEAQVKAEASLITMLLTSATQSKVEVVKIRSKSGSSETRASTEAIMEVYFVYANGTALNSDSAEIILSNSKERFRLQTEYGLKDIGGTEVVEKQVDPVLFVLLGLVAGLIIVLAVMSTTLVCTRRSYRTKLKAAKAMNSAAMMGTGVDQKNGPVVPGTNKYTMDGANPVLNLNMDTATDLGFDEEGSNTDRLSLNSLDYNIDMVMSDKDNMPMMRIQEEDEVEYEDKPYVEPLSEALAQRGKKRDTNSPKLTFNNPAFSSTTDL